MPGFNLTSIFGLLQEALPEKVITPLYQQETTLLPKLRRRRRQTAHGRWMRGPVDTQRVPNAAAHAMGVNTMPGDEVTNNAVARRRDAVVQQWTALAGRMTAGLMLDGELVLVTGNGASFAEAGVFRIKGTLAELGKQREQQLFRRRGSEVATVNGVVANVVTVNQPTTLANAQQRGTKDLVDTMSVRFYDASRTVLRNAAQTSFYVQDVDGGAGTFQTVGNPTDVVAGDTVVLGDDNWDSNGEEWTPLPEAAGDVGAAVSYLGLSRLDFPRWSGTVVAADDGVNFGTIAGNAGAALLARACAQSRHTLGGGKFDLWTCSTGMEREPAFGVDAGGGSTTAGLVSQFRNEPGIAEGGASKTIIHIMGVGKRELLACVDHTPHTVFGLTTSSWSIYDAFKPQWLPGYQMPGQGEQWFVRSPETSLRHIASRVEAAALVCNAPPRNAQITGLNEAQDD